MEGAEAHVVDAALAQGYEVRHDIVNLRRVQYPVYGGLVYHTEYKCTGYFRHSLPVGADNFPERVETVL